MARILMVDDSATAVQFARTALRPDGHVVEALDSFIRLASIVAAEPPDVVLLDLSIAAMSGTSVANVLRKYEAKHIPILLYSSRSERELREAATEMGAFGFLQKSSRTGDLRRAVAHALAYAEAG